MKQPGILLFEDGAHWIGCLPYPTDPAYGEAVFNTAMGGYEEVLTDPSYCDQVVTFTAPHIGNTGITLEDGESARVHPTAVVVRELSRRPSSWRSRIPLEAFLRERGIPVLEEVDTRAVTRHLRERGAMRCLVAPLEADADRGSRVRWIAPRLEELRARPAMEGAALAWKVSRSAIERREGTGPRVVIYDFGVKNGIIEEVCARGHEVIVVPAGTPARDVRGMNPAGILLSNGPGDPAALPDIVAEIRELIQARVPIFGICLGHQLLALALGARTHKLKFGHRGVNHPVQDLRTGRVAITSHNHGFAVVDGTLPDEVEATHRDLYDGTLEGFRHRALPIVSVQYHPESRPGPGDSASLFDDFSAASARQPVWEPA